MYFERKISDKLRRAAATSPAIVLTGARQTGKTTLLRASFPTYHYVSLDLPSLASKAEQEPEAFLSEYPEPLIIDEVQYAPKLFRHLKLRIDQDRRRYGRFILTGSQKFTLMREVSDSLAGRCLWFELEGFALAEIAGTDLIAGWSETQRWTEMMLRGSFPELWLAGGPDVTAFMASYLATYLERDVRQLLNVASLRDFERFIRACAVRNGQLLEKSGLARDVGVNAKTIDAWLSVLTASNQISLLEPWFSNAGKRLVKSPKLYFNDTGMLCYLLGIDARTLAVSPFLGAVWEAFVYSELRKALQYGQGRGHLWFYRDDRQLEVDFLLLGGGHGDLIEAKATELPGAGDGRGLRALLAQITDRRPTDLSTAKAWLVCRAATTYPLPGEGGRVAVTPLGQLADYAAER